jgi:hypothetical protein
MDDPHPGTGPRGSVERPFTMRRPAGMLGASPRIPASIARLSWRSRRAADDIGRRRESPARESMSRRCGTWPSG